MAAEGVALAMFYKFHSVEVHFFFFNNMLTHMRHPSHKVGRRPLYC